MGGGGGGYSSSSQDTQTSSIVDSYNETYSAALNLTNVGNVSIGPQSGIEGMSSKAIAIGAVGLSLVAAFFVMRH